MPLYRLWIEINRLKKEETKYQKYVEKENKKIIKLQKKSARVWKKWYFDREY